MKQIEIRWDDKMPTNISIRGDTVYVQYELGLITRYKKEVRK